MTTTEITTVDIWVDPICPFAWMTSRWLTEVAAVRPLTARYHLMSLSVLNENRDDISEFYQDLVHRAWGPARVMMAAELTRGACAVQPLYEALATRIHHERRPTNTALYRDALADVGLDTALTDAATISDHDDAIRASHHAGMDPVGEDVGTPVIHLHRPDGIAAFFGPVVTPIPRAESAGRLFDAITILAETPEFFELKRSRSVDPTFH